MADTQSRGAFGKRGTFTLVLIGIAAFVAFIFLVGQGGLQGTSNNGQAHVAGKGLAGYAGLARMLENDGIEVVRSRERGALDIPGLLVLTPPPNADPEELTAAIDRRRTIGPTLVIAPKWFAMPAGDAAEQPGWVNLLGAIDDWQLEVDGQEIDFVGDQEIRAAPRWEGRGYRGQLPSDNALMHLSDENADGSLAPLVEDEQGRMLAGHLADDGSYIAGDLYLDPDRGDGQSVFGVMLIAEPDLVNNWGLAEPERAALALELIDIARQGEEGAVTFDMTFSGLGATRNLLTLAFEPPFLAATLTLLLALAIVMWRAFSRFGPALRPTPEIAHGKGQLVTNGAQVVMRSGRMRLLREPYEKLARARIAQRLGLRETDHDEIESQLAARGAPGLEDTLRPLRSARSRSDLLRAARALRDLERTLRT